MALSGWIKLHRALADHHIASDPASLSIWVHLLVLANHAETKRQLGGQVITLQPGQLIASRKSISEKTGVQESKVERVLRRLEIEQQIEQRGTTKFRVISITNWRLYQSDEQQNEPQMNNKRTASEQQVNTPEECKESKECEEKSLGAQGKPEREKRVTAKQLVAEGVDENHAKDWLAVRKAKRAPLTLTALEGVRREASTAGITLAAAIKISAENGWQGFKASWLTNMSGRVGYPVQNKQQQIEDANNAVVREIAEREQRRRQAEQGMPPQGDFISTGDLIIEGEYRHA